jgi:hypothetical protein
MKERGILIIALVLLLFTFFATGFSNGDNEIQGKYVNAFGNNEGVACSYDLIVLNGKYLVPCDYGLLNWDRTLVLE